MTAGEPQKAAETGERALSADEADRLAAAIRPSWELDDNVAGAGGGSFQVAAASAAGPAPAAAPAPPAPVARAVDAAPDGRPVAPPRPSATPTERAPIVDPKTVRVPDAPPAGSQGASDTIIEGVPTIAVGSSANDVASSEAASARPSEAPGGPSRVTRSRRAIDSTNSPAPAHPIGGPGDGERGATPARHGETAGAREERDPAATQVSAVAEPAAQETETATATATATATKPVVAPVPAGRTRLGIGEPDAGVAAARPSATPASVPPRGDALQPGAPRSDAPQSRPPARAGSERPRRTSERVSAPPASIARVSDNEPIELPVTGTSKATLRVGIVVVGAAFLFFAARAMFSSRGEDARPATVVTATPAAREPAQTTPPQAAADTAAPIATQTTTARSPAAEMPAAAAASAATTAAPPTSAAPGAPDKQAPAPKPPTGETTTDKHAAAPKPPTGEKRPASPPASPTQGGTGSTGGKKGGGIIRDAPF